MEGFLGSSEKKTEKVSQSADVAAVPSSDATIGEMAPVRAYWRKRPVPATFGTRRTNKTPRICTHETQTTDQGYPVRILTANEEFVNGFRNHVVKMARDMGPRSLDILRKFLQRLPEDYTRFLMPDSKTHREVMSQPLLSVLDDIQL